MQNVDGPTREGALLHLILGMQLLKWRECLCWNILEIATRTLVYYKVVMEKDRDGLVSLTLRRL